MNQVQCASIIPAFHAPAQAVRELGLPPLVSAKSLQAWIRQHRVAIGLFNNCNLLLIVRLS